SFPRATRRDGKNSRAWWKLQRGFGYGRMKEAWVICLSAAGGKPCISCRRSVRTDAGSGSSTAPAWPEISTEAKVTPSIVDLIIMLLAEFLLLFVQSRLSAPPEYRQPQRSQSTR